MKPLKHTVVSAAMLIALTSPTALLAAEGEWDISTNIQGNYGSYDRSQLRKSIRGGGVILSANYLERGGVTLSANTTQVQFKSGPDTDQQSFFASGHYNTNLDALPGTLSLRLDGHAINNNDTSGNTSDVTVVSPQISFITYDKSLYLDLSLARSTYQGSLTVDQYRPTIGFGFNQLSDWLQIRGYHIVPSQASRAQNKSSTTAVELKWMHWPAPGNLLNLDQVSVNALVGERIYAVDGDAAAVYNLADIQRGSLSLGLQWRISESTRLLFVGGQERFLDNTINNSYDSRFAYLNLSTTW